MVGIFNHYYNLINLLYSVFNSNNSLFQISFSDKINNLFNSFSLESYLS